MKKPIVVISMSILAFHLARGVDPQIVLQDPKSQMTVTNVKLFEDLGGKTTIEGVLRGSEESKFRYVDAAGHPIHPGVENFWLRFEVRNETGSDQDYIFDFKRWSHVEFFTIGKDGSTQRQITGNYLPWNQRDYPVSDQNWILRNLKAGTVEQFAVHLNIHRTSNAVPSNFSFKVIPLPVALGEQSQVNAIVFLFLGIYLVMFLYNLFVFISTRDLNYVFYLMVVLAFALFTLNGSGHLFSILSGWESLPEHRGVFNSLNVMLVGIGSILFVSRFLNLKVRYPNWSRIFKYTLAAVIVVPFTRLAVGFEMSEMLSALVSLFFISAVVTVIIKSCLDRFPSAYYLILGVSISAVGSFVSIFADVGMIEINSFSEIYALSLGSGIEMVLFSFALANKIKVLRKENASKQEKLIEQFEENERLQTGINLDLEQKVADRTSEIMNQKEIIELEKEKSEKLLLNILPKFTAEELKMYGRAMPRYHENATVLFTDFQGFTRMSRLMTAEAIHSRLDYCFQGFDHLCEEFEVEKIKTIGDSYMCVSGVPEDDPDHAVKMVMVGLRIRDFIRDWNVENERQGKLKWEVRIGIHSGPLISGVIGNKKLSFDIWGNTVNLASRMEKFGEVGKVNVSQATFEITRGKFRFSLREGVPPNWEGNMEMYFAESIAMDRDSNGHESHNDDVNGKALNGGTKHSVIVRGHPLFLNRGTI